MISSVISFITILFYAAGTPGQQRTTNSTFDGSRRTTVKGSPKMRRTIKRLRLPAQPASASIRSKRRRCSSFKRKEYLQLRGLFPSLFSISFIYQKAVRLGSAVSAPQGERFCRTNRRLSNKNTARYRRATVWIGHEIIPRNSRCLSFGNIRIVLAGHSSPRCGEGRVSCRGRAALRLQYYDDFGRRESTPNGHRRHGTAVCFSGLKTGISCSRQTDMPVFQSLPIEANGGVSVYVNR